MGLALGRFFLNTEDLHFGYWPNNEKPTVKNFSWAQNNHSDLISEVRGRGLFIGIDLIKILTFF